MAVRSGSCVKGPLAGRRGFVSVALACVLGAAASGLIAAAVDGAATAAGQMRVYELRVGGTDPFERFDRLARSDAVDMAALPDGDIVVLLTRGSRRLVRIDRQGIGHGLPVPTDIDPGEGNSVVAAPGGALLVSDGGRVLRLEPDGRVVTVAGTPKPQPASGDGGPAVGAGMEPTGLALLPDGSLLIADRGSHRIRRVDPAGQISTVAGTGEPGSDGDGGRASAARLSAPVGVAAYPDGSYLIAHGRGHVRVRRVSATGRIRTVIGLGSRRRQSCRTASGPASSLRIHAQEFSGGIAALPDGGFLLAANTLGDNSIRTGGVIRVSGAGAVTGLMCDSGAFPQRADGRDVYVSGRAVADAFTNLAPSDVAVTAEGGIIVSYGYLDRYTTLRLLAKPGSQRLGVALAPRTLGAVHDGRVVITATSAASVRVSVHREGRLIQRTVRRVRAGENTVRLPRRLGAGVHDVRVLATTADGRSATDRLSVLGRPHLTISYAMRRLRREFADSLAGDGTAGLRLSRCRSQGPRRVTCQADFVFDFDIPVHEVYSLALRPDGLLQFLRAWDGRTRSVHAITP